MRSSFIILFLVIASGLMAQQSNTSVYSRFGIGDIHLNSNVMNRGMSGLSVGIAQPLSINFRNSAALSYIARPTLVLGAKFEQVQAESLLGKQSNTYSQFDHFAFAFPIAKRRGGISIGVVPYSNLGYTYSDTASIPGFDEKTNIFYDGAGGLNTMFFKTGYRIKMKSDSIYNDYLSLGFGFKYYFGSLTNSKRNEAPEGLGFVNSFVADQTTYSDVGLDYSMMYKIRLMNRTIEKEPRYRMVKTKYIHPSDSVKVDTVLRVPRRNDNLSLNLGFTYTPSINLSGIRRSDAFTYQYNFQGVQIVRDSISSLQEQEGFALLPGGYGVGLSLDYSFKNKRNGTDRNLIVGLDYVADSWNDFETNFLEVNDYSEITNSDKITFGLQYRPNIELASGNVDNYFQACTYRLGVSAANTNINLGNQQITDNGINLGISLPLIHRNNDPNADSHIDLSVGYGEKGRIDNGIIKENYVRVMFGIRFHPDKFDKWFGKRKYD